jgi:hypothetical protein
LWDRLAIDDAISRRSGLKVVADAEDAIMKAIDDAA